MSAILASCSSVRFRSWILSAKPSPASLSFGSSAQSLGQTKAAASSSTPAIRVLIVDLLLLWTNHTPATCLSMPDRKAVAADVFTHSEGTATGCTLYQHGP